MRIGTLVRWTGDSEDYGCLGVVSKDEGGLIWVLWVDGSLVDYRYNNSHSEYLEVLCE